MTTITSQRVGVYGCILNSEHKLLILKRAAFDTSPNLWEMPGGTLELGEEIQNGIIREIKEETGLAITPLYPVTALSGISKKDFSKQIIRIAYLCFIDASNQTVQLSTEHADFIWIDPHHITHTPLSDLLEETLLTMRRYPFLFTK